MADAWTLELEDLDQLGEALPILAPALTAAVQQDVQFSRIRFLGRTRSSSRAYAVSGLIAFSCPHTDAVIVSPRPEAPGASRVLLRLCSCMRGIKDSGGPPNPCHCGRFVLPSSRLRLSASASWPVEAAPIGTRALQRARPPLRPTGFSVYACPVCCSQVTLLRNGTNTRYGRVATPYPTGTFTRQETPGFARRDNLRLKSERAPQASC